ncbi:hypothetical protein SAMN04490357_1016 [Streptomyces misionensis]|uniref:Uncharacterized protein n=1 Tax=Streptomyces misionensis TaxID=67331 RepID=A0A1H4P863_9ACTN|nr:hypothetical protein [Streptomyces misionensis]SEC03535.1 hypothetical protein SAMN04490357_1016 [Streptomyces misionensis]
MSWLDRLLGNDHERAATQYAGRESATERATRQRRASHHRSGAQQAARAGQAWEDRDRAQDTKGRWYRAAR